MNIMSNLLALAIEIPDWLFSGQYWGGFFTCAALGVAVLLYAMSNFNPFGR
jgi:hypothetical protein